MAGTVKPIPDNYHRVTPYLIVNGAADAIDFYKKIYGATEIMRMPGPDGKIGHAELKIGDSTIMLADATCSSGGVSTRTSSRPAARASGSAWSSIASPSAIRSLRRIAAATAIMARARSADRRSRSCSTSRTWTAS